MGGHLSTQAVVTSDSTVTADGGTFEGSLLEARDVSVTNGGRLTSLTSTATQMYELELQVSGNSSVDSTGVIDVSGKGYLPGRTTGNTSLGGATNSSGGSYGGSGAGTAPNALYGDFADPKDWGAGGTSPTGGGLVHVRAGTSI